MHSFSRIAAVAGCRAFQSAFKAGACLIPWPAPQVVKGENSLQQLPGLAKRFSIEKALVVTDQTIASFELFAAMTESLAKHGVKCAIYDKTPQNPTTEAVETAFGLYKENSCSGIIAIGGGSPIDCAKGVLCRIVHPGKQLGQLKGVFRVLKKTPPLFAIPTTAGTGSEATLAAVIKDSSTKEKYAISDPSLMPDVAILDPLLTLGLPPSITAATGMDALTHAVEACIGRSNTRATTVAAWQAARLVFENLETAFNNGKDIKARSNMQQAAYLAGVAFTRAYVGNVHALAHALGGLYGTPHGLANAILLPAVLERYTDSVWTPLSQMAIEAGVGAGGSTQERAESFIAEIKKLSESLGIPKKLDDLKPHDIPKLAARAAAEANPLYPVPVIFFQEDFEQILQGMLP
ncbi:MAG: iron-containing alcohol dehydrogenase [Clostridiales bacterium]|nr:iron-containing alcohol dehydrogenase [Clostridiales bacterium]